MCLPFPLTQQLLGLCCLAVKGIASVSVCEHRNDVSESLGAFVLSNRKIFHEIKILEEGWSSLCFISHSRCSPVTGKRVSEACVFSVSLQ